MRSRIVMDEVERFDWVRRSAVGAAACLTFVRGTDVEAVARGFGAVAEPARDLDFDEFCEEAFAYQDVHPVIGIRACGDWLLVAEDDGFEGSRPEVLRHVSAESDVTSVFWNGDGLTRFSRAAGGNVRTSFEALMPGFREGTRTDELEGLRADLPWSEPGVDPVSLMLALSARVTGQRLVPELFEGRFATFPVAARPEDLPGTPGVLEDSLRDVFPAELVTALHGANGRQRRRVAVDVARWVLDRAGCLDQEARRMLAAITAGSQAVVCSISERVRFERFEVRRRRATSVQRLRVRAVEVLRQAANANSLIAAFAVLVAACGVRGCEPAELVEVARRGLAGE